MPTFTYDAIDISGATIEGTQKANTLGEARALLIDKNLYPVKLAEKRGLMQFEITKEKVKNKELLNFTRQLSVFVTAGISITDALDVIGEESTDNVLRRTVGEMVDDLRNGSTLSAAAAKHPQTFPAYYVSMIGSAELTGKLDETLTSLADYLERDIETRATMVSALTYPSVVMVLAIVTVTILAGYVLPKFKPLFEELGTELPLPTRMLLAVSTLFTDYWYVLLTLVLVAVVVLVWLFKSSAGKPTRDSLMLRLPLVGGVVRTSILERFCRILATIVTAGVPLLEGLRTAADATDNTVYRKALEGAQEQMLEGVGFSTALSHTGLFPGAARQMFKVGEETGTLDKQLVAASSYFSRELKERVKKFAAFFEPALIVFVGLVVGFVAIALVSAMYGAIGGMKGQG